MGEGTTGRPPSVEDEETSVHEPLALLLAHLRSGPGGLTHREAERRLVVFGPNVLRRRGKRRFGRALVRQFVHPLALLLWVASLLAFVAGTPVLGWAIIAVIVLNALLAFVQEQQASGRSRRWSRTSRRRQPRSATVSVRLCPRRRWSPVTS